MRIKSYVHVDGGPIIGYTFECPGCGMHHAVQTNHPTGPNWGFNLDENKPTFSPSLLVRGTIPTTDEEVERIKRSEKVEPKPFVCHSFITDGKIQFLGDCTHKLAGQTVELAEI